MRPLIAVAIDEIVELCLPLQEVVGSRLEVHALVVAVLLRVAGFNAIAIPSLSHQTMTPIADAPLRKMIAKVRTVCVGRRCAANFGRGY